MHLILDLYKEEVRGVLSEKKIVETVLFCSQSKNAASPGGAFCCVMFEFASFFAAAERRAVL